MPKIHFPTVETCRWRSHSVPGQTPRCDLVTLLIGGVSDHRSAVSNDVCLACCRSFPPSARRLNPVVASVVYRAACQLVQEGGADGCTVEQLIALKARAERSLDVELPENYRLTPIRPTTQCAWLGSVLPNTSGESSYQCGHPAHESTTLSGCLKCHDWTRTKPISRHLTLGEMIPLPVNRSGPPVQNWAVGVTTAPRKRPTLESCLDSIVRAGWERPRLFLDGTTQVPERYSHLPVTWREDPIGAWPAWYLALAELVLQQPDADAYVMLQDDVVLYDREPLTSYLERVLWPGERSEIISLFYTTPDPHPGWHCSASTWYWGAQGLIFPPEIARMLLCDVELSRKWLKGSFDCHIPIPEVISDWAHQIGIRTWYPNPSLIQHIGNTSTIWTDAVISAGRRAPWFSGSLETSFSVEESLADFPEKAFVCSELELGPYQTCVLRGRARMRNLSVVFCGLCRDVRRYLPGTAARIERLGSMFRDYRVVLFENDSVDGTLEFLRDWQTANSRIDILSDSLGTKRYPQIRCLERAEWMANYRNRYRERVLQEYGQFDYAIVIDTDLPGGWSYDGIAHTFGESDWDFVGSNGLLYRIEREPDEPPFLHFDTWAFNPAQGTQARTMVNHNDLFLHRGESLLPVESCYGGLGVYRLECMRVSEYGGGDCEHVVFHRGLRSAGLDKLFLNPNQIVLYSPY